MASATKSPRTTQRKTVNRDELTNLISRRAKSSYPTDARTERQYWLRQIKSLMGDNT